ncbi:hypothetical protein [Spiroplasma endosymbiont of Notiophilus biguttatus]|uniref:hypothetical protein n=1 Tax=Spiroplasma endosymbiont of Notiophilus biguttatus TaxID=3066285 RepID=UPI00313F15CF
MNIIKAVLRLMSTVALTTVSTSSVIACDNQDFEENLLNAKVSQNLKLTNATGEGLLMPIINVDENDKSQVTWKINTTNIKVINLVKNDKRAKDEESFQFLKNVLNIKIDSGTKLEDAIFNETELNNVTTIISNINVDLNPVTGKNDFYIVKGSYNIMFTNGVTKTDKYKVVTKTNPNGVVGHDIFSIKKTDFNSNFQSEFKVGQSVSKFQIKSDLTSMLDNSKDNVKIIFGIQKLLNKGSLKLLVTKNDKLTGNFIANDKITVRFKIGEFMIFVAEELIVNP